MIREALSGCTECGGTGKIDMGFYTRDCMRCRDASGNELFDEPASGAEPTQIQQDFEPQIGMRLFKLIGDKHPKSVYVPAYNSVQAAKIANAVWIHGSFDATNAFEATRKFDGIYVSPGGLPPGLDHAIIEDIDGRDAWVITCQRTAAADAEVLVIFKDPTGYFGAKVYGKDMADNWMVTQHIKYDRLVIP